MIVQTITRAATRLGLSPAPAANSPQPSDSPPPAPIVKGHGPGARLARSLQWERDNASRAAQHREEFQTMRDEASRAPTQTQSLGDLIGLRMRAAAEAREREASRWQLFDVSAEDLARAGAGIESARHDVDEARAALKKADGEVARAEQQVNIAKSDLAKAEDAHKEAISADEALLRAGGVINPRSVAAAVEKIDAMRRTLEAFERIAGERRDDAAKAHMAFASASAGLGAAEGRYAFLAFHQVAVPAVAAFVAAVAPALERLDAATRADAQGRLLCEFGGVVPEVAIAAIQGRRGRFA